MLNNVQLRATTLEDVPLIESWIKADPFHSLENRNEAEWLLTGGGLLSFCLTDPKGPLCFVRLDVDKDETLVRVAIQFGPESEISKRRLVVGLMRLGFPAIIRFAKNEKFKGVIFESVNSALIDFLKEHQDVTKSVGINDYELIF